MKKLKSLIAILILGISAPAPAGALSFLEKSLEASQPCMPKEGDPFPWLFPLEIPWDQIEGTWKTQGEPVVYLSIKVIGVNAKGARYVQMQLSEKPNSAPFSTGVGFVATRERILETLVSGPKVVGRVRVASIAFPLLGCSKIKAETAVQLQLFDRKGKELV
ncbi:MAG: hypothetical protein K2X47_19170, partial [Bdellovibrionales bacterium]|nr:hypothetical protein [Bdellovibrionales bacterium]